MQEAYDARKNKVNSYAMYFLEKHEAHGTMRLCLKDYNGAGTYTPIDRITSLAFRSDAAYSNVLENAPNATKDASSTGDIALRDMFMFDGNFEVSDSFKSNEPITAVAHIITGFPRRSKSYLH